MTSRQPQPLVVPDGREHLGHRATACGRRHAPMAAVPARRWSRTRSCPCGVDASRYGRPRVWALSSARPSRSLGARPLLVRGCSGPQDQQPPTLIREDPQRRDCEGAMRPASCGAGGESRRPQVRPGPLSTLVRSGSSAAGSERGSGEAARRPRDTPRDAVSVLWAAAVVVPD
jgi:hypothetical protein